MQIIAEVKTRSPFGWRSDKNWNELFEIADDVGDIISIHTDPRWGGSFKLIKQARGLTDKPILAKGIHSDDKDIAQALDNGADYVLVVGRIPAISKEKCLIEPRTIRELKKIPPDLKAVWNSRDLNTGGLKKETFKQAREVFSGWLCQASNINGIEDINRSAEAILIGQNLPEIAKYLPGFKQELRLLDHPLKEVRRQRLSRQD